PEPQGPAPLPPTRPAPRQRGIPLSQRGRVLADLPYPEAAAVQVSGAEGNPFRISQPDVAHFPYATWARLVARRARRSLPEVSLYQHVYGYLPLREAIAAHIALTRGVQCTPDQIIVTAGAQEALSIVAHVVLDPG